ncbi:DUF4249 domain-containing protein [Larkinella punicea]|uniref:DUF4249 domain-containing protein n=1 Tax=Larkinella punicea TaxID=2315727 RepID=A0A368JEL1_9BACT|nr:DUF4249 domain-containing protein [Larkinella punicea]RCR66120.1 DUF4249 domain-containing protein [Larkinella punicea]
MKSLILTGFLLLRFCSSPFVFLILGLVSSCISPYQPDTQSIGRALVVEGLITDQPGPYAVNLTQTADYTYSGLNLLVSGATVTLSDNAGNQEVLREVSPGYYQTTATGIRGTVGRSYKIAIRTTDGKQYESSLEVLKTAPPISQLTYEFQYNTTSFENDKRNTWAVYLDTKDPETPGDYYRWVWKNYEFTAACLLSPNINSDGYYIGLRPCCTDCWDINQCYSNCINISSDAAINGKAISRQYIMSVPFTSRGIYYVEVEQQSISPGAYQFFNSVKKLVNNTGGLFDAAPAAVGGNIKCTSHPGEVVYGYFGAAGVSVMALKVDRSKDAVGIPNGKNILLDNLAPCLACENSIYRTPNKPRFWDQ